MTDYQLEWHRFKRLRDIWVILFFSKFVILVIEPFFFGAQMTGRQARFDLIVDICWGVPLLLLYRQLFYWKCPRCGKAFAGGFKTFDTLRTYLNWLFLPRQCVNCRLPRYSIDPAALPNAAEDSSAQAS